MANIILGTAGHVDHGKTSLVKALTGVDTDRLKEEKERGITIELGFASLRLPNGLHIGIVDVPGHERFIKNMVAGAAGIDLVALVVAADEGVMPQTKEHLDICSLLGIQKGIVALTKADMVGEDWRTLVMEDLREFLQGTFLADAPIVPCSAVTGDGLQDFLTALAEVAAGVVKRPDAGMFRLPVDRVFTMKGFGTVVTGTAVSGSISIGGEVEIMPTGIRAKVRGIQVHSEPVEKAGAGLRTAVNIQGLEKASVVRGDVLSTPGALIPTQRMDVHFHYLPINKKNIKSRTYVRFHAGTSEIIARLAFLSHEYLAPGQNDFAQLFLEKSTVLVAGDRFVIRSYSPVTTIGGGIILDPMARKHRHRETGLPREMETLLGGTDGERLEVILRRAGLKGSTTPELVVRTGMDRKRIGRLLEDLFSRRLALLLDADEQRVISIEPYRRLLDALLNEIQVYHEKNPLKEGMPREELRSTIGAYHHPKLFATALRELERTGRVVMDRESVRLPGHRVSLDDDLARLKQTITTMFREAALSPPTVKELLESFPGKSRAVIDVLKLLTEESTLIKVTEDLYYDRSVLEDLREDYRTLLMKNGSATPATFKELTGLTRKFIIPLMEYFDRTKLTIRTGEHRILRNK